MSLSTWLSGTFSHSQARRAQRRNPATTSPRRWHNFRPILEGLEIRLTLSLTTLASFGAFPNGYCPVGGVIIDSSGNLYGTTAGGGAKGYGTVFELAQGSGAITTLATFNGTNGMRPDASLIMDSSGNLYGTTYGGGASDYGTIFRLTKGSGTITTLASFNGTNGKHPEFGALIMDSSGNLYGTTSEGGCCVGTVFELAQGSGTITTLASSNMQDDAYPLGGVIMDSSGNLYGTAAGFNGYGSVFELAHGSGKITVLAKFDPNTTTGTYPYDSLIMDSSGDLYGTASHGGVYGYGTVFEWVHGSHQITPLASFNGTNGSEPYGGLIMDSSGDLYGTTYQGGGSGGTDGYGTVLEVAHGSGTITDLASFDGTNGLWPEDGLIMDSSGNLYGTTFEGGSSFNGTNAGYGTVFELSGGDALPAVRISGLRSSTGSDASRTFAVTVPNAVGITDTGYAGTADFTSNARTANLTANDTAADIGTDPFSGFVPQEKGKPSITDARFSSITGSVSTDGS